MCPIGSTRCLPGNCNFEHHTLASMIFYPCDRQKVGQTNFKGVGGFGAYMETILLVDVDRRRASRICDLLSLYQIPVKWCPILTEILQAIDSRDQQSVILAHCEMLNESFGIVARPIRHPKVRMFFYCTDAGDRAEAIAQLPQELAKCIKRLSEIDGPPCIRADGKTRPQH